MDLNCQDNEDKPKPLHLYCSRCSKKFRGNLPNELHPSTILGIGSLVLTGGGFISLNELRCPCGGKINSEEADRNMVIGVYITSIILGLLGLSILSIHFSSSLIFITLSIMLFSFAKYFKRIKKFFE